MQRLISLLARLFPPQPSVAPNPPEPSVQPETRPPAPVRLTEIEWALHCALGQSLYRERATVPREVAFRISTDMQSQTHRLLAPLFARLAQYEARDTTSDELTPEELRAYLGTENGPRN